MSDFRKLLDVCEQYGLTPGEIQRIIDSEKWAGLVNALQVLSVLSAVAQDLRRSPPVPRRKAATQKTEWELGKEARRREYFRYQYGWAQRKCAACAGSGYYDNDGSPACGACDGTGRERYQTAHGREVSVALGYQQPGEIVWAS